MITGILLLVSTIVVCLYFIGIGLRPLSLIPGGFFLLFLSSIWSDKQESEQKKRNIDSIMEKYGLIVARGVTMIGIRGVTQYLNIDTTIALHGLIGLNITLLIGSLLYQYKDGRTVFHVALRVITIILRGRLYRNYDIHTRRQIVRMHIAAYTAIYACIHFLGGLFTQIPTSFKEILSILTNTTIILLLLQTSTNMYHGLFIAQVYITIIYSALYYIYQRPETKKTIHGVSLQDILAGQRILGKQTETTHNSTTPQRVHKAQQEIGQLSSYTKASLSILNIIVIIAMMIWFFVHMQQGSNIWIRELLYRLSIILFIINFIIIKKIDFYYKIQRVFVFFIINFAIYLSLLNISHLLQRDNTSIVLIATIWNITNSIAIFYSQDIFHRTNIKKADYYYRIAANLIAMIINIILIIRLFSIPSQLRFALVTIYVGVQGYLMYYNLQYIKKIGQTESEKTTFIQDNKTYTGTQIN